MKLTTKLPNGKFKVNKAAVIARLKKLRKQRKEVDMTSLATVEEIETLLKSGEDMRIDSWPGDWFVRLAPANTTIPGFIAQPFRPGQTEMFCQNWEKA